MELIAAIISAVGAIAASVIGAFAFRRARRADNELRNGTSDQLTRIENTQADHGDRLSNIEVRQSQLATGQTQLAADLGAHVREAEQRWRKGSQS